MNDDLLIWLCFFGHFSFIWYFIGCFEVNNGIIYFLLFDHKSIALAHYKCIRNNANTHK